MKLELSPEWYEKWENVVEPDIFMKGCSMSQKKEMVIVRGLPGSGKSSIVRVAIDDINFCNQHADVKHSYSVHSTDNYFSVSGNYVFKPNRLHIFHKFNQSDAEHSCENGVNYVFIDNTNTTWKEIETYVAIAKKYGYDVSVIEPKNFWAKDVEECSKKNTHGVPKDAIQRMLDRWQDTEDIVSKIESTLNAN